MRSCIKFRYLRFSSLCAVVAGWLFSCSSERSSVPVQLSLPAGVNGFPQLIPSSYSAAMEPNAPCKGHLYYGFEYCVFFDC